MSMKINHELPLPEVLKSQYPLSQELKEVKKQRDEEIRRIFTGESDKFIVLVGPCSADNEDTVCEYVRKLKTVADKVSDKLMIIPRVYTNKPRTTGDGYKGMLHQPDPDKAPDLLAGIIAIRKMHMRVMQETGLSSADEMLYPENRSYLDDILSYEAVGARSVENQQHRLTASGMDIPVGMKNPTSGDLSVMLNSVTAAQHPHHFIYRGNDVETSGNDLAHTILRGGVNQYGQTIPNYHYEDLIHLSALYAKKDLKNPAIIIDANHSNSNKQYKEQIRIVSEVLHSRNYNPDLRKLVKGVMIESYLEPGAQKIGCGQHVYGKSITDPCLGWDDTEKLIYDIAGLLGPVTREMAVPLYVAVSTDTGCFVYGNTTADTHRTAAALMETGIPAAELNKRHFRTKTLKRLRIESRIVEGMELFDGGETAVAAVDLAMVAQLGADERDLEDIASFVGQVEGVKNAITIRELRPGTCKLSLRTDPEVLNASRVCALLGGGGHAAASGATVEGSVEEAKRAILWAIEQVRHG